MKSIKCEMCESVDVVKQGDYYVCQSCGTKYETEAAKKLMVEIDNSSQLDNLLKLARRAKEEGNAEMASKYYSQALELDPDDWEAHFYSSLYAVKDGSLEDISTTASSFSRTFNTSFRLLNDSSLESSEKTAIATEIAESGKKCASRLVNTARKYYGEFLKSKPGSAADVKRGADQNRAAIASCLDIYLAIGDGIESVFSNGGNGLSPEMKELALGSWKEGAKTAILSMEESIYPISERSVALKKRVGQYDSEYIDSISKSGGCYVATAVYGSYDCPEVWTLRRFRDYRLKSTYGGRAFIKAYYFVSPTLVKAFGEAKWFNALFRHPLDALVERCKSKGYADTPYSD